MSSRRSVRRKTRKYFGLTAMELGVLVAMGVGGLIILIVLAVFVLPSLMGGPQPQAVAAVTPSPAPSNTPLPTDTPAPTYTYTPRPTNTRVVLDGPAADTPVPVETSASISTSLATGLPPIAAGGAVGQLTMDTWGYDIQELHLKPGPDDASQVIVLIGNLNNNSAQKATFSLGQMFMLRDAAGNEYVSDTGQSDAARNEFNGGYPSSIVPGGMIRLVTAFVVPATEKSFTLVSGSAAASWGGDVAFTIP